MPALEVLGFVYAGIGADKDAKRTHAPQQNKGDGLPLSLFRSGGLGHKQNRNLAMSEHHQQDDPRW
jgi:hypothetical protein